MRLVPAIALWLFVVPSLEAEPSPGWDDSAVRNAGTPPLPYEGVPAFGDHLFNGSHLTLSHQGEGGGRWHLIFSRQGEIWSIPNSFSGESEPHLVCDVRKILEANPIGDKPANGRRVTNLLGGVLDRDYPRRPWLYLVCNQIISPTPGCCLIRCKVSTTMPMTLVDPVPEVILTWESNGHNGSDLHWGPDDGYLYFSAGDGSAPGDPDNIGQQVSQIRGSILRIDVHTEPAADKKYIIPDSNPFVGIDNVKPEIWSYGLRNPWRMSFHPETKELWVGDNGDESVEMVHRIKKGSNAGWSTFEGSLSYRPSNPLGGPTKEHTPPKIEHPHPEMRSVIGGIFYRGKALPDLQGHYIYGCYMTKEIWAAPYDIETDVVGTPFRIARSTGPLVAIREDHNREMLVTSLDGHIERLRKRPAEVEKSPWPEKLSETGLFTDVANHTPAPGVYEYLINAEGWADGATRRRFVAVPAVPLRAQGAARYYKSLFLEVGGAYVQTLFIDQKPVETQMLYNSGIWQGYTYRWNDDGSDAYLVAPEGLDITVGSAEQKWRYPSRAECVVCHNQSSMYAIAFTPNQLDRTGTDGQTNQLDDWLKKGILGQSAPLRQLRGNPAPNPYDPESGTVEQRARYYLAVNCAHCHREAGLGGRAAFRLANHLSLEDTGLINTPPMIPMLGKPQAKIISPGQPELSELLGRVNRRGPGQMPLIGTHKIDQKGVQLLREWILSLPH
ncbi:MAG: PQQ-dependent sugar dehydrogenase [Verrucomicrobiales bacterium]|nr:PQQ-dependent sugar dehydrogenase [Verrucomicrobiales bacterium]